MNKEPWSCLDWSHCLAFERFYSRENRILSILLWVCMCIKNTSTRMKHWFQQYKNWSATQNWWKPTEITLKLKITDHPPKICKKKHQMEYKISNKPTCNIYMKFLHKNWLRFVSQTRNQCQPWGFPPSKPWDQWKIWQHFIINNIQA